MQYYLSRGHLNSALCVSDENRRNITVRKATLTLVFLNISLDNSWAFVSTTVISSVRLLVLIKSSTTERQSELGSRVNTCEREKTIICSSMINYHASKPTILTQPVSQLSKPTRPCLSQTTRRPTC